MDVMLFDYLDTHYTKKGASHLISFLYTKGEFFDYDLKFIWDIRSFI